MLGFERQNSGVGGSCFANCATTSAHLFISFFFNFFWCFQAEVVAEKTAIYAEVVAERTAVYAEEARKVAERHIEIAMQHWRTRLETLFSV